MDVSDLETRNTMTEWVDPTHTEESLAASDFPPVRATDHVADDMIPHVDSNEDDNDD
jgi:hypothetical protein